MLYIATALAATSAYQQSEARKDQADYNRVVSANNAKMAEYQAVDAAARGEQDAMNIRRKAAQLKGDQRATMAARGLDLSEGTTLSLLDQTDYLSASDIATARTNANKEVFAKRSQAHNFQVESAMYGAAADAENPLFSAAVAGATTYATGSMLAGAGETGSVASKWNFGGGTGSTIGNSANTSNFSWATGGMT
jgi:hypothetical protein